MNPSETEPFVPVRKGSPTEEWMERPRGLIDIEGGSEGVK
jgi:hypothetical protein